MTRINKQTVSAVLVVLCGPLALALVAGVARGGDAGCYALSELSCAGRHSSSRFGGGGISHAGLERYAYIEVHCPAKAAVFINGHTTKTEGEYRIFRTFISDGKPRKFTVEARSDDPEIQKQMTKPWCVMLCAEKKVDSVNFFLNQPAQTMGRGCKVPPPPDSAGSGAHP